VNLYTYVHNNPVNWIDPLGLLDKSASDDILTLASDDRDIIDKLNQGLDSYYPGLLKAVSLILSELGIYLGESTLVAPVVAGGAVAVVETTGAATVVHNNLPLFVTVPPRNDNDITPLPEYGEESIKAINTKSTIDLIKVIYSWKDLGAEAE